MSVNLRCDMRAGVVETLTDDLDVDALGEG